MRVNARQGLQLVLGRAWVNGEWSKRSLQREEMKSEEREATGKNKGGGEKILKYSN